jgi:hypothetical protein
LHPLDTPLPPFYHSPNPKQRIPAVVANFRLKLPQRDSNDVEGSFYLKLLDGYDFIKVKRRQISLEQEEKYKEEL